MDDGPVGASDVTDPRSLIGPRFIDPQVIQSAAAAGSHRYPYAVWTPLPETATQVRIDTTTFILHSMAGPNLTTLDAITRYYMRADITGEPTFALDLAGRACQYMATDQRADNNAQANRFAASVETQDRGAASLPSTEWSGEQVAQLAGMAAFLNLAEGVPLRRPDRFNSGGVDGHRAFPEWSIYVGKTCPGDARWRQIPLVLELAAEIVAWSSAPTPEPSPAPAPAPAPAPISKGPVDMIPVLRRKDGTIVYSMQPGTLNAFRTELEFYTWAASGLVDVYNWQRVTDPAKVTTLPDAQIAERFGIPAAG